MDVLRRYRYELIAALSGAVVMVLELVGARLMAPFFGTSLYVWTAIIGVILGALALGYWYGGRLADKAASDQGLMIILASAGVCVAFTMMVQDPLLTLIAAPRIDVRLQAFTAALVLFAPASAMLGIISPYVAKLKLSSLATAGSSIGRLYAAGTLGSIIGTFLAGYWLIAWFGNFTLGVSLVVAIMIVSFIAERRTFVLPRVIATAVVVGLLAVSHHNTTLPIIADVDSPYARYQVLEGQDGKTRYLTMDNVGVQSAAIPSQPDVLLLDYTNAFRAVAEAYPEAQRSLVIGGGTYTFPQWLARAQADNHVDVVEIDPALDRIAEAYFGYRPRSNLTLMHDDGRVFLNHARTKYDVIYVDAFSSLTPPYHLTTVEATQQMKRILNPGGMIVVNVVAAPSEDDVYFAATFHTYRSVFSHVNTYRIMPEASLTTRQNVLLVLSETATPPLAYTQIASPRGGMLLTDDHAPVEQLIHQSAQ